MRLLRPENLSRSYSAPTVHAKRSVIRRSKAAAALYFSAFKTRGPVSIWKLSRTPTARRATSLASALTPARANVNVAFGHSRFTSALNPSDEALELPAAMT